VLLLFLVIQQVENNVLAPRISGHAVGLHPLGAMFALLAGFQLAGLLGAAYRNVVVERPPQRQLFPLPRFRRPARRPVPDA
jgi:hypothetical protein